MSSTLADLLHEERIDCMPASPDTLHSEDAARLAARGVVYVEEHTPWARAVFSEQRIWLACYCGWNVNGDDPGAWNDHFR